MKISDEVIAAATGMHPEEREYPDDVRRDFHAAAEWARKEALDEVLCLAEKNRVILKTTHRGYTVEDYSDPLVRIAVIRALTEGDQS